MIFSIPIINFLGMYEFKNFKKDLNDEILKFKGRTKSNSIIISIEREYLKISSFKTRIIRKILLKRLVM